jgi:hypothetical protein
VTDQELQLAQAKMLPEKICLLGINDDQLYWGTGAADAKRSVLNTELLYLCQRTEESSQDLQNNWPLRDRFDFKFICRLELVKICGSIENAVFATWQQRAEALIKVKSK